MTHPVEALRALREATTAFTEAELEAEALLDLALGLLLSVTQADAGAVAVPGAEPGQPRILAQRRLGHARPASRTVLAEALSLQRSNAIISQIPSGSHSVLAADITTILCAPVVRQGRTHAAVYLDRRGLREPFDTTAHDLLLCFASVIALAVDLSDRVAIAEAAAEAARAMAAHMADWWSFGNVTTRDVGFAQTLQTLEKAARADVSVLLMGETGTGKEHLARCIHANSSRARGPFIAVNCAAVPEALFESELFGHERGAFTGAVAMRRGKVEQAHGGTLFLDEIGDLPPALQPKLLRVLQEREVWRVGASESRSVDIRVLAATHKQLIGEVHAGRFREDLYYRLKVVSVTLPALRERVADIRPLAEQFLAKNVERSGRTLNWTAPALAAIERYSWPGNVRELRNAVELLGVMVDGDTIQVSDVEVHVLSSGDALPQPPPTPNMNPGLDPKALAELWSTRRTLLEDYERRLIDAAIKEGKTLSAAARLLGVTKQTLSQKCKRMGITL